MKTTIKRSAVSLTALALFIATPAITPAFATPVETDTIIDLPDLSPISVAFSPNGKMAYVGERFNDAVLVIDVATGTLTSTIDLLDGVYPVAVAFSPNGKRAYVANRGSHSISVIK
jgi:YVTN family beta-propeller protein